MAESRRSNSLHDAPSGTGTFSKMGFIASPRVMHFCLYDHAGMRVQHRVPGVSPGPESCPPHLPPPAFGVVMVSHLPGIEARRYTSDKEIGRASCRERVCNDV